MTDPTVSQVAAQEQQNPEFAECGVCHGYYSRCVMPCPYSGAPTQEPAGEPVARERINEMEELLRSACAIAERMGSGTAWNRFAHSIRKLGLSSVTARTYRLLPSDVPDFLDLSHEDPNDVEAQGFAASRPAAPASVAPLGCDWRTEAIQWLRKRAADQSCVNASYPLHIGSYKHWAVLADQYQRAAEELEAEQASSPFGLDAASPQPTTSAQEPLTNIACDVIDGYKAGLAGEPMGMVSAAFDCGWISGDTERRAALAAARKGKK